MNAATPIAVVFAIVFSPAIYRMLMPIPAVDVEMIKLYCKNRDEYLVGFRKLWLGGTMAYIRNSLTARIYRVTAKSSDGAHLTHDVATFSDADGILRLAKRTGEVWRPVIQ